ncbi:MAG: type II secretion system F family protein [Peptococcaceae bacterium]|nr:type II secretion system F family protein [Peptococcaceae bacterium]
MQMVLLTIDAVALFFVCYYLWDVVAQGARNLKFSTLADVIDARVLAVMEQYPRTRGLAGRLEQMLRATSVRLGDKPLKLRHFVYVTIGFSGGVLTAAIAVLNNIVAGLLLAGVAGIIPYELLQFDYIRNRKRLKKQTPHFLLAVGNMFNIYGDPIMALERLVPQLNQPLKREIAWLVDNLKYGVPIRECIKTVKLRLPDPVLRDFMDDLLFYTQHGGDFQENIINLVKQAYQRDLAVVERKTATGSTVLVFLVLVGVYFVMLLALIQKQPEVMSFMVKTFLGKVLVVAMICIFITAGYFTKMMVSVKED